MRKKKSGKIPEEAIVRAEETIQGLDDPRIEYEIKGRFLYILTEGDPLCRFDYQESGQEWGFAIYKYSTGSYSKNEFLFPKKGKIDECINFALNAYNL